MSDQLKNCPCQSGKRYLNCCQPIITGNQTALTPEQLMRSRYTAYSLGNIDYIEATMIGEALVGFNKLEALHWSQRVNWLGLEVIRSKSKKDKGLVEFIARYVDNQQIMSLHETSEFVRKQGRWFYCNATKL